MEMLLRQAESLMADTRDPWANMANLSAFLFHELQDINWLGFYRVRANGLLLGPFQGRPACVHLPPDKGVCAHAAATRQTVIVDDVHAFPGHISCDARSRSELVTPVLVDNRVKVVLDIDSPVPARFTVVERLLMEKITGILADYSDWSVLT